MSYFRIPSENDKARYVRVKAQDVVPMQYPPRTQDNTADRTYYHYQYELMGQQFDEETSAYIHELGQWAIPQPPIQQAAIITMKSITPLNPSTPSMNLNT
ncbi:hypothetical protein McaMca56_003286 [Microsporum canis]